MSKHTPGPWSVFTRDGYATYIRATNEGGKTDTFVIASCECATIRKYFPTRVEAEANARLISAAPELLAALKNFVDVDYYTERERLAIARAAIAKATGEA